MIRHTRQLLQRAGLDGFILGLIGMVLLAYLFPEGGMDHGFFSLSRVGTYGVSLVFFFYGLKLNTQALVSGLRNWKLHILIQLSTFLLFPLIIVALKPAFAGSAYESLWLGSFFLAALPSTVSSSVVMVSIARGNIPAAIFNASISSILGIFLTPFWMQVVTGPAGGGSADMQGIVWKLTVQVLLPLAAGLLLHGRWGGWADRNRKRLRYLDQTTILIIVYTSFCESFAEHIFSNLDALELFLLAGAMAGLFLLVYLLISLVCRMLGFGREDRITAVFCGSKKSLVHGSVMVRVLFPGSNLAGMLLLPLMCYHALQLIIVSMIAQRMARENLPEA